MIVIEKRKKHQQQQIIIDFNNRQAYKRITKEIRKSNEYMQEAGAEIAIIKKKIKNIKFNVEIKFITQNKQ